MIGARVANLLGAGGARADYRIAIGCDGCARPDGRARAGGPGRGPGIARAAWSSSRTAGGRPRCSTTSCAASTAEPPRLHRRQHAVRSGGRARRSSRRFGDPDVGAACGRLRLRARAGGARDSRVGILGSRDAPEGGRGTRSACASAPTAPSTPRAASSSQPLPEDTTSMDDFLIPARVARAGRRVVFAGDAVAREDAARDVGAEVSRRFRIGIGGGQVLRREAWLYAAVAPAAPDARVSLAEGRALAGAASGARGGGAPRSSSRRGGVRRDRGARASPLAVAGRRAPVAARLAGRAGGSIISPCSTSPSPSASRRDWPATAARPGRGPRGPDGEAAVRPRSAASPWRATSRSPSGRSAPPSSCGRASRFPARSRFCRRRSVRFNFWNIVIVAAVQAFSLAFFGLYRDHERFREPLARLLLPGSPRGAGDAGLDLLSGAAVLLPAVGSRALPRLERACCWRSGEPPSTDSSRSRAAAPSSSEAGRRRP